MIDRGEGANRGVGERFKGFFKGLKESEKLRGLLGEEWQLAKRDWVLTGLAILEFIPIAELVPVGSKLRKLFDKVSEEAPKVQAAGKLERIVSELYPDVSKPVLIALTSLNAMGVPIVGAGPEVIQLFFDSVEASRGRLKMLKEVGELIRANFGNSSNREQINQAVLRFSPQGI